MDIRRPLILTGQPFDWEEAREASRNAVQDDGSPSWREAFAADPGVVRCPQCLAWHWAEGTLVACWACATHFHVDWRHGLHPWHGSGAEAARTCDHVWEAHERNDGHPFQHPAHRGYGAWAYCSRCGGWHVDPRVACPELGVYELYQQGLQEIARQELR